MTREFSAGGIVLNNQGQVLLIQANGSNRRLKPNTAYWGFPKGQIEAGHTSQETALREVKEEGGVEAEIVERVGYSKYVYTHPQTKDKIFKIVAVYLMKYLSGDPKDHDWEVAEAGWFTPEEALKKLSFSQDRQLLEKALGMVHEQ